MIYRDSQVQLTRVLDEKFAPKKRIGVLKGKINIPDDFNEPLPETMLAVFEDQGE